MTTFQDLAEDAREWLDGLQARYEAQGAQRYTTLGSFLDVGDLLTRTWQFAGGRIFEKVIDVLDVPGYPKGKLDELVDYWVQVLMSDAWPTFGQLVKSPPSVPQLREQHPEIWGEESRRQAIGQGLDSPAGLVDYELPMFWMARTLELVPDGHQRSEDLSDLMPALDEALVEGGSTLAPAHR